MTGIELLEQQIADRYGVKKASVHNSMQTTTARRIIETMALNLDLVSDAVLSSITEREEAVEAREAELTIKSRQLMHAQCDADNLYSKAQRMMKEAEEKEQATQQILDSICQAETPEARDRLRLLEIFKQSVEIETPQNNSVYIAGMASILSGTPVFPDMGKKRDDLR